MAGKLSQNFLKVFFKGRWEGEGKGTLNFVFGELCFGALEFSVSENYTTEIMARKVRAKYLIEFIYQKCIN